MSATLAEAHAELNAAFDTYVKSRETLGLFPKQRLTTAESVMENWAMICENVQESDTCVADFIRMFVDKKLGSEEDAQSILKSMKAIASRPIQQHDVKWTVKIKGEIATYIINGVYRFAIDKERYYALRNICAKSGDEIDANVRIVTCLLKYGTIFGDHRQLSAHRNLYQKWFNEGYDVEGMSSALNSQILMVGGNDFCSLYPNIEKVFGSIGSFFETDFTGRKCVVHPPRIAEVIQKSIDYCVDQLKTRKCAFKIIIYYQDEIEQLREKCGNFFISSEEVPTYSEDFRTGKSFPFGRLKTNVVTLSSF